MTTPNEELISMLRAKGCPDWVTARWLMESAADLLQSQAEHIATLEDDVEYLQEDINAMCNAIHGYRWSGGAAELIAECFAERDELRAELADMAVNTATYEHLVGLANDTATRLLKERDTLRAQLVDAELHTKQVERGLDKATAQLAEIEKTEPVFYEYQWTNPGNQPHQPESRFVWARVEPAWNGTVQQKVDELLAYRYDDKPTYRVRALYPSPIPAQRLTELKLLMLTTAYEQGVGKGIQRRDCNPYAADTDEHAAWKLGYEEGLDKPMPSLDVTELVEALEMIVSTHQGHCEHHVGVSKHSYNLADIAEEALSKYKGAK